MTLTRNVLSPRVVLALAALWVASLIVSLIQGEGERGGGFTGFLENVPWFVFLLLTALFLVLGLVVIVRAVARSAWQGR